ncbi:MAG: hypothetical protein JSS86_23475 [Cyanobacteria bacterium SZAS LIN-2]|nr:hypothetical protein [Cyanobacteria bacterium SZAS LIN-2]
MPQQATAAATDLDRAKAVILARTFRPGEAYFARYSSSIMPLLPEIEVIERRGVDLIALADALERGLSADLVGQVLPYRAWDIDEFNRFNRSTVSVETMNAAMKRFLDDPRHW